MIMPIMNGGELLSALRHDDVLAPLPVVVVSATPEEAAKVRALIQGFVKKPVDFRLLLELVERYC
jgi:CheY-like chemotaxis protein